MTTPQRQPEPSQPTSDPCCGGEGLTHGGAWVPKKDQPQVVGCGLCRNSGRYWGGPSPALGE